MIHGRVEPEQYSSAPSVRGRRLLIAVSALISLSIPIALATQLRAQLEHGFSDFQGFYGAGKIVASGRGPDLYETAVQRQMQWVPPLPGITTFHYYVHAPFEALLFAPLARLPFATAVWVWWAFSLLCAYLALFVMRPFLPWIRRHFELGLVGVAIFIPVIATLFQGQDSNFTLLFFALCFGALSRGRYFLAGAVLAVAMYKPPLALPMILLLTVISTHRWRLLAGFVCTGVLELLAAIAAVGWKCVVNYPTLIAKFPDAGAGHYHVSGMPNIRGLITLVLEGHTSDRVILLTVVGVSIAVLAFALRAVQRASGPREAAPLVFALFVTTTLLVGFQEYAYDLSLLYLPILLAWNWWRTEEANTLNQRLVGFSAMVLLLGSFLCLASPAIYACCMVVFFIVICRELWVGGKAVPRIKAALQTAR